MRAGETVTAWAKLDSVSISYWDDSVNKWVADADARFRVTASKDSCDEGVCAEFSSAGAISWVH